jgi:DNA polymerase-1
VRDVFIASPGNVLVVSDLSQIELRMLAHFTQDARLLQAYRENLDLHGLLAEQVFGEDFSPFERSLAKNGNFSVLYGASAPTLVRRYGFPSRKVAQQVLDGFYDTYRRVAPWKEEVLHLARSHYKRKSKNPPYVTTILGRKRRLPALWYLDNAERYAAERQAISVTISGSAADLFKLAMIDVYELLRRQSWQGNILMTVHDELVVEVPRSQAEDALQLIRTGMENVVDPFTGQPILSVPIVADAKIVTRWSEAK